MDWIRGRVEWLALVESMVVSMLVNGDRPLVLSSDASSHAGWRWLQTLCCRFGRRVVF
jgi:hypothetical protein